MVIFFILTCLWNDYFFFGMTLNDQLTNGNTIIAKKKKKKKTHHNKIITASDNSVPRISTEGKELSSTLRIFWEKMNHSECFLKAIK